MAENQEIPDWLAEMRDQQPDEAQEIPDWLAEMRRPEPEGQPPEEVFPQGASIPPADTLEGQVAQPDVVEDLREQIAQSEDDFAYEGRTGLRLPDWAMNLPNLSGFLNLRPWQGLVVAVLIFLDVALCGCLGLTMLGRVRFPF